MSNKTTKLRAHYRGSVLTTSLQRSQKMAVLRSMLKPLVAGVFFMVWIKAAQVYMPSLVPVILPACLLVALLMLLQSASEN